MTPFFIVCTFPLNFFLVCVCVPRQGLQFVGREIPDAVGRDSLLANWQGRSCVWQCQRRAEDSKSAARKLANERERPIANERERPIATERERSSQADTRTEESHQAPTRIPVGKYQSSPRTYESSPGFRITPT